MRILKMTDMEFGRIREALNERLKYGRDWERMAGARSGAIRARAHVQHTNELITILDRAVEA